MISNQEYTAFRNDLNDIKMLENSKQGYYLGENKIFNNNVKIVTRDEIENILKNIYI